MQVLRDFCALSLRCHRKQPWRMMKPDERSPMSSSFRTAMSALLLAATCSMSSLAAADPVRYELDGNQLKPRPVVFETGSDKIRSESDSVLQFVKGI